MSKNKTLQKGDKVKLKEGVKPIPLLVDMFYYFTKDDVGVIHEYPVKRLSGGISYDTAIIQTAKWGYTHPQKALVYINDIVRV